MRPAYRKNVEFRRGVEDHRLLEIDHDRIADGRLRRMEERGHQEKERDHRLRCTRSRKKRNN